MTLTLIIPWDANNENLHRAFARVELAGHLRGGGFRLCYADCGPPWSPGGARNFGARVLVPDADPLVFVDADTIVPWAQIRAAAIAAEERPGLVYGYTLYIRKTADGRDGEEIFNAPSIGCAAISRTCFEQIGGFDEGFVGWGYEDLAFEARCRTLWPTRRIEGVAYHRWHGDRRADGAPADSDPAQVRANEERWRSTFSAV